MPKKKGKDAPAAPEVNVEELQLKISQLAEDIFKTKDKIEARAKDYADSLSTFDVPYPLTSLTMSDGVLYAGSLDKMVIGIDATAHADRFQVQSYCSLALCHCSSVLRLCCVRVHPYPHLYLHLLAYVVMLTCSCMQATAKAPVFSVRLLQEIDVLCAGNPTSSPQRRISHLPLQAPRLESSSCGIALRLTQSACSRGTHRGSLNLKLMG